MAAFFEKSKIFLDFLQPTSFPGRYIGERPEIRKKERSNTIMNLLRRLIQSAIESFPIDQERKEAILKKLLNAGNRGAKK